MAEHKWLEHHSPTGGLNYILKSDDGEFYVSYNPNIGADELSEVLARLASMLGEQVPRTGPETALYDRIKDQWYILSGDHRHGYEAAMEDGFSGCLAYYKANLAQRSAWSTDNDQRTLN